MPIHGKTLQNHTSRSFPSNINAISVIKIIQSIFILIYSHDIIEYYIIMSNSLKHRKKVRKNDFN